MLHVSLLRSAVARCCALGFTIALSLAGCGGNNATNSGAASPSPQAALQAAPSASAMAYQSSHHRHRHHHGYAAAEPSELGGSTAVASAQPAGSPQPSSSGSAWPCNDAQFLADQRAFETGALSADQEVDVCGAVTAVRGPVTRHGLTHGYYDLQVAPSETIEIVCDLTEMDAPAWPWVKAGDYSYVQGRYYYDNPASQGIDWTHRGTSASWRTPGYVVIDGTEYQ